MAELETYCLTDSCVCWLIRLMFVPGCLYYVNDTFVFANFNRADVFYLQLGPLVRVKVTYLPLQCFLILYVKQCTGELRNIKGTEDQRKKLWWMTQELFPW